MPKIEIEFDLQANAEPGTPTCFAVSVSMQNPSIANKAFAHAVAHELAQKFAPNVMVPAAQAALTVERSIQSAQRGNSNAKH